MYTHFLYWGLEINAEGEPWVTSPGQISQEIQLLGEDYGAPLEIQQGSQTFKTQSCGKSLKSREALGTPCGYATKNQGRLLQVNISWIWQKRRRVKSFHWMAKMLDVGFSKPFIIYIAEKSNQRGNIWHDKFYLNLLLVMGDSSSCHKGSQEKNVAYPRSRTKCLLASNVTVMQLNKHFSIHFKIDLNLMLMLGHFMDVCYPCIIIIIFTECFLEGPYCTWGEYISPTIQSTYINYF